MTPDDEKELAALALERKQARAVRWIEFMDQFFDLEFHPVCTAVCKTCHEEFDGSSSFILWAHVDSKHLNAHDRPAAMANLWGTPLRAQQTQTV